MPNESCVFTGDTTYFFTPRNMRTKASLESVFQGVNISLLSLDKESVKGNCFKYG
jgi:hypothetical protein